MTEIMIYEAGETLEVFQTEHPEDKYIAPLKGSVLRYRSGNIEYSYNWESNNDRDYYSKTYCSIHVPSHIKTAYERMKSI